jgi:hypothetical protein
VRWCYRRISDDLGSRENPLKISTEDDRILQLVSVNAFTHRIIVCSEEREK